MQLHPTSDARRPESRIRHSSPVTRHFPFCIAFAALLAANVGADMVLRFNGSTYIDMGKAFPVGDSVSLSAWVRIDPSITNNPPYSVNSGNKTYGAGIVGQGYWGNTQGFGIFLPSAVNTAGGGRPRVNAQVRDVYATDDHLASLYYHDQTLYTDDEWHHYLLVRDKAAGKAYLYVDGELDNGEMAGMQIQDFASDVGIFCDSTTYQAIQTWNFVIGKNALTGGNFKGCIADVCLWDVALDADDVERLKTMRPDQIGKPPRAYWPLDDGAGSRVANRADGTVSPQATGTLVWENDPTLHLPRAVGLTVTASPRRVAAVTPAYGLASTNAGATVSCSAPATFAATHANWELLGWNYYEDGRLVNSGSTAATNITLRAGVGAVLEWLWRSDSASGAGSTYWVATAAGGGNDANPGTEQAPFATLGAALAAAGDGDTVRVRAGTYSIPASTAERYYIKANLASGSFGTQGMPAWWVTKAVSIVGDGPGATFFDGANTANRYAFLLDNANASLSGVAVKRVKSNVNASLQESALIHVERGVATDCAASASTCVYVGGISTHLGRVAGCEVSSVSCSDSESMGAGLVATAASGTGDGVISNCQAYACSAKRGAGLYLAGPSSRAYNCVVARCTTASTTKQNAGVLAITGQGAMASHCVVTNNQGIGGGGATVANGTLRNSLVAFNRNTGKTGGGGVSMSNGTIDGCTIAHNANEAADGAHGLLQTGGAIVNSIVAYNGATHQLHDAANHVASSGTCTYTCTYPAAAGDGNATADPLFRDVGAGDFELKPDSPARNAGTLRSWMAGALDLAGAPRIHGRAVDLGCYECYLPLGTVLSLR